MTGQLELAGEPSVARDLPACHPEHGERSIRGPPAESHWVLRCAQDDKSWVRRTGRVAEARSHSRGKGNHSALKDPSARAAPPVWADEDAPSRHGYST